MKRIILLALAVTFVLFSPYLLALCLAIPFVKHAHKKQEQRMDRLVADIKKLSQNAVITL